MLALGMLEEKIYVHHQLLVKLAGETMAEKLVILFWSVSEPRQEMEVRKIPCSLPLSIYEIEQLYQWHNLDNGGDKMTAPAC